MRWRATVDLIADLEYIVDIENATVAAGLRNMKEHVGVVAAAAAALVADAATHLVAV